MWALRSALFSASQIPSPSFPCECKAPYIPNCLRVMTDTGLPSDFNSKKKSAFPFHSPHGNIPFRKQTQIRFLRQISVFSGVEFLGGKRKERGGSCISQPALLLITTVSQDAFSADVKIRQCHPAESKREEKTQNRLIIKICKLLPLMALKS